jgi:hypothetical protein
MIVFLHIPKTGGTTIQRHFERVHGERYLRLPGVARIAAAMPTLSDYDVIVGHIDRTIEQYIPTPRYYTMLRNPVARLLSLYRWWHDYDSHSAMEAIRNVQHMSFREFVEHPGYEMHTVNGMCRQLAQRVAPEDRPALDLAIETLDLCQAVGISETSERFTRRIFGNDAPALYEQQTGGGDEPIDRDTLRYVLGRNTDDCAVYEYAWRLSSEV